LIARGFLNHLRAGIAVAGCGAIVALALTGCGGGSDSSTGASGASGATGASGGTPLSQDEFVSQADAACKEANDKIETLKAPTSDLSSLVPFADQSLALENAAYAKLAALTPPSDLQAKYSKYLSDVKAQIAQVAPLKAAAEAGDTQKVQDLANQLKASGSTIDSQAKALGLTECSRNVQPQG
jgi:hypothetical protein